MTAIKLVLQDVCAEWNGKLGKIIYDEVVFTKQQFPKSAAKKAMIELEKLGIFSVNIYNRKQPEYSVDKKIFENYLTNRGVSYPSILEPTVQLIVT